jgi:hypothetical protein
MEPIERFLNRDHDDLPTGELVRYSDHYKLLTAERERVRELETKLHRETSNRCDDCCAWCRGHSQAP